VPDGESGDLLRLRNRCLSRESDEGRLDHSALAWVFFGIISTAEKPESCEEFGIDDLMFCDFKD
jgi:hypothetical protein